MALIPVGTTAFSLAQYPLERIDHRITNTPNPAAG
jgi:hypothetical protein